MDRAVRKRLLQGGGATVLGQISTTVVQLASVPLFLGFWGVELYGAWLILSTVPTYFAMSDVGLGTAASNEMTRRVAQGDQKGALSVFQSAWIAVTVLSTAILTMAVALAWALPIERWLNLSGIDHVTAAAVLSALLLHVAVHMQGSVMSAAYRATGMYAQSALLGAAFRLIEFAGVAGAVALGAGPVGAACAFMVLRVLMLLWYFFFLHSRHRWIVPGVRHASTGVVWKLASPAVAFMGFPIGYAISGQGVLTVISVLLGPAAVVTFSTVRTVVNSIRQAVGVVNATVWPELSMAFGSGNLPLARALHQNSCKIALWVALGASSVLLVGGNFLIRLWTDGQVHPDPLFFHVMLAGAVGNALWSTSMVVPSASNRHQRVVVCFLIAATLALLLAVISAPAAGLVGVAASLLVIDLLMLLVVLRDSLRLVEDRLGLFLRSQVAFPDLIRSSSL